MLPKNHEGLSFPKTKTHKKQIKNNTCSAFTAIGRLWNIITGRVGFWVFLSLLLFVAGCVGFVWFGVFCLVQVGFFLRKRKWGFKKHNKIFLKGWKIRHYKPKCTVQLIARITKQEPRRATGGFSGVTLNKDKSITTGLKTATQGRYLCCLNICRI